MEDKNFDFSKTPETTLRRDLKLETQSKPTISVITPFYNSGDTIEKTAQTLFNQTYPFFEWIIVDDGSTDKKSVEKLKEIAKMDNRIKVYRKNNSGPSVAREYAISKTSDTKYIYILDSDDLLEKTILETLYWTLETHPEYSFAYTNIVNFGEENYIWEKYLTLEYEVRENIITGSAMIVKKDFLEVGGYGIKEKGMYEDWVLWLKMFKSGKGGIKVSSPLFWYRKNKESELNRAKANNKNAMKYVTNVLNDGNFPKEKIINFPLLDRGNSIIFDNNFNMVLPKFKKSNKKVILFVFPWMVMGGADIFNLELIKGLNKDEFYTIVLTALPQTKTIEQKFREVADEVYDMATFLERKDTLMFADYLIKSRNVDILFVSNSDLGYSFIPPLKQKNPNISVIDYIHNIGIYSGGASGGFGRKSFEVHDFIDKTFSCNNATARQLKDIFNIDSETVYIGVDNHRFNPKLFDSNKLKEKYGVPKSKKVVSFIARFSEEKRPLLFLEVAEKMLHKNDDLYFLIVGYGPMKSQINYFLNKTKYKENFKLIGYTEIPEEIYSISDTIVICSETEGLALTAYEGASMGVPIVSSDVGGQSELVNKHTGVIVDFNPNNRPKEMEEYIKAIEYALKNKSKISKTAQTIIKEKFSIDIMVSKFSEIFKTIKTKNNTNNFHNIYNSLFFYMLKEQSFDYNWLVNQYNREKFGIIEDDLNFLNSGISQKIRKLKQKYIYFKIELREYLWQKPWWRKFIKFSQKHGLIKLKKKIWK